MDFGNALYRLDARLSTAPYPRGPTRRGCGSRAMHVVGRLDLRPKHVPLRCLLVGVGRPEYLGFLEVRSHEL